MEVRFPVFLKQLSDASLSSGNNLDRKIDGITGATLSVHAMERMARAALYFDKLSRTNELKPIAMLATIFWLIE